MSPVWKKNQYMGQDSQVYWPIHRAGHFDSNNLVRHPWILKIVSFSAYLMRPYTMQIFAFALQMWFTIWGGKSYIKRNVFTSWQEFRLQCRSQIQMNNLNITSVAEIRILLTLSRRKKINMIDGNFDPIGFF